MNSLTVLNSVGCRMSAACVQSGGVFSLHGDLLLLMVEKHRACQTLDG